MRVALSPRWLRRHLLLVLAVAALILLGRWQWGRGIADRDLRNLLYGVQWWLFAGLAVYGWWRALRIEVTGDGPAGRPAPALPAVRAPAATVAEPNPVEEDDEVAAYNRHLAALNARAARYEQRR